MASVKLLNVSKYHGKQLVLDSINLSIEAGEFIAVIGPSGCGKSTLLRLIAGLDHVSHGEILINNQCVNDIPPAKRDMAMVFQNYALYPHMTVFDNMAYSLKMRKIDRAIIRQRVEDAAEILELSHLLHRKPQALSGGQRQRAAMGRAIVRSPSVFLFDEPLSNLDPKLRFTMCHEIKKLHQQLATTCIYITHDQTEAMTMAGRILVLNNAHIEQISTPTILYKQPASLFTAEFTANYPLNVLPITIDYQNKKVILTDKIAWPLPTTLSGYTETQGVIALRAEDVKITFQGQQDSFSIVIQSVDTMGADKLIQALSACGKYQFTIRAPANTEIPEAAAIFLPMESANIFNQASGLRLGGWA